MFGWTWLSGVVQSWRRISPHNPKVGGSNPPPATKFFFGLQAKLIFSAGAIRAALAAFFILPREAAPKRHLYDFAVGCGLRVDHGVTIDVHGGTDMPLMTGLVKSKITSALHPFPPQGWLFLAAQIGRAFVLLNRIAAVNNDQLAGDIR